MKTWKYTKYENKAHWYIYDSGAKVNGGSPQREPDWLTNNVDLVALSTL